MTNAPFEMYAGFTDFILSQAVNTLSGAKRCFSGSYGCPCDIVLMLSLRAYLADNLADETQAPESAIGAYHREDGHTDEDQLFVR